MRAAAVRSQAVAGSGMWAIQDFGDAVVVAGADNRRTVSRDAFGEGQRPVAHVDAVGE